MIKPDIAKTIFKLIEHFKSSKSDDIKTIDHCFKYLKTTKYLKIRYFVAKKFNLIVRSLKKNDENYTFKLFDDLIN